MSNGEKGKGGTNPQVVIAIISGVVALLVALFNFPPFIRWVDTQLATPTPTSTLPSTSDANTTPTFTITSPPIVVTTPPSANLAEELIDSKGVKMVLVPAGPFSMGTENGDADEKPAHQVSLDAYYIDKYEVTNTLYAVCVSSGTCLPPINNSSSTRPSYYKKSEFNNFPVIFVNWEMANTYCEWRGGRLPTEAEWEKAARGTDAHTYAWGEEISCSKANYQGCKADTTAVGSYESGKSPYGAYDMTGNVWEWVADWYGAGYYSKSPEENPLGALGGTSRVFRGGSWNNTYANLRAANRGNAEPSVSGNDLGLRCVASAGP